MSSPPSPASRSGLFLFLLVLCTSANSQPICDVLLRPAFHYTTNGLTVHIADSSTTFGQVATTMISFGDGSSPSASMSHTFTAPGTYTVCMTMNTTTLNCSSSYCRQVTVPLNDCGSADPHFNVGPGATNSLSLTDLSIGAINAERLWEFGDGATSDHVSPAHTWLLPGPHFVSLTLFEGQCTSTYGRWTRVDGNATTCLPHLFLDLSANIEGTQASFEPQLVNNGVLPVLSIWSYGDGNVDTALVGFNQYPAAGEYQTCLLVGALIPPEMDTCFSLVCRTNPVLPLVGVPEPPDVAFRAWPNPFRDIVFVEPARSSLGAAAEIHDALGRRVHYQLLEAFGTTSLRLGSLSAGTYWLVIHGPGGERRAALVKEGP